VSITIGDAIHGRSGVVMIEAQFVFRRLETVFDGSAAAFHAKLDGGPQRPSGEEGQALIRDIAPDQNAARPKPRAAFPIVAGIAPALPAPGQQHDARLNGQFFQRFPVRDEPLKHHTFTWRNAMLLFCRP